MHFVQRLIGLTAEHSLRFGAIVRNWRSLLLVQVFKFFFQPLSITADIFSVVFFKRGVVHVILIFILAAC